MAELCAIIEAAVQARSVWHNQDAKVRAARTDLWPRDRVGKTRMAVSAAAAHQDAFLGGVWFVALAPIRDPDLVPSKIAQTLGIKESGDQSLLHYG